LIFRVPNQNKPRIVHALRDMLARLIWARIVNHNNMVDKRRQRLNHAQHLAA
jgi:hypothetical protein